MISFLMIMGTASLTRSATGSGTQAVIVALVSIPSQAGSAIGTVTGRNS